MSGTIDINCTELDNICILDCLSEQDKIWNITWPAILVGGTATMDCPGGNKTIGKLYIVT